MDSHSSTTFILCYMYVCPSQELFNTAKLSSSVIPMLDLTEMRCKSYYKILNGNCTTEPTGIKNWKNKFPDYFKDWRKKIINNNNNNSQ